MQQYMVDYSIVICTYNPDERLLKRCLHAVHQLDIAGITIEVIIVDNNSSLPVSDMPYVKAYTDELPLWKSILVPEQGVKYARIAAIEMARGKYTVYFDHDNEPERDYLQQLQVLHAQYPQVAAWGPGHVTVDFVDGIERSIAQHARLAFQERHEVETRFASIRAWQACYPFGTGLCTPTALLKDYVALARQGRFTLPGRKGKLLTSGEDTQMILLCIEKGYAAGNSPALRLKHMIPADRANAGYLKRLAYGTSLCYATCLLQVFPETEPALRQQLLPPATFSRRLFKKAMLSRLRRHPLKQFELASWMGSQAGIWEALELPLPPAVKVAIKYMFYRNLP